MIQFGKTQNEGTPSVALINDTSLPQSDDDSFIRPQLAVQTTLFVHERFRDMVFPSELVAEVSRLAASPVIWIDPDRIDGNREVLAKTEVLFATWGMPMMDDAFLDLVPKLKAVFYAAGSPKGFLTPAVFARGISVSTAAAANATPVAEFTVAAIIFSLKQVFPTMRETRLQRSWVKAETRTAGGYRSRVGVVSLGMIGQRVAESLKNMDVEVLAYDPHAAEAQALAVGVTLTNLEEIFETCDVVSLHTPWLPSTEGMIGGTLMARMKPNATLINTSRGRVVREDELCEVLASRPDLTAILDVAVDEPPGQNSPLWDLPNIFLTPHISGSVGPECARMGRFMVDEFHRMLEGVPRRHEISPHSLALIA